MPSGSVQMCVLASGSGGNCSVLRTPGGVVLIDAGLGPRLVSQRLASSGGSIGAADVTAVCLTHLDRDHFNPNWLPTLARRGIRLFCHARQAADVRAVAAETGVSVDLAEFDVAAFEPVPGLLAEPIHFAHDQDGSHGFLFEGFDARVGYATDLGHVPNGLVDRLCTGGLDVVAIESNYDRQMQLDSPRPHFLKRRIMGGRGHLSNDQAFDAVRRVFNRLEQCPGRLPLHVVLLHRSRQCNCPHVVRRLFSRDARIASRLVLSNQDAPTEWLRATREPPFVGKQLELAWG